MATKRTTQARLACTEDCKGSEEHTSELQSPCNFVCRLLLEKKIDRTTLRYGSCDAGKTVVRWGSFLPFLVLICTRICSALRAALFVLFCFFWFFFFRSTATR